MNWHSPRRYALSILLLAVLTACGGATPDSTGSGQSAGTSSSGTGERKLTSLTIGVIGAVQAFGLAGTSTAVGGWTAANELHSHGLVTADVDSRKPVGRLAEDVPTFENGTMEMLSDGRQRVQFRLRSGITWHDGEPFTARDMAFAYALGSDQGLPFINRNAIDQIDAMETPDDRTVVIVFKGPYYLADSIGLEYLWPYPEHILRGPYERYAASRNPDDLFSSPYWTTDYVHLGPYRVVTFDPGEGVTFGAHAGYFLGSPRIDTIRVRTFSDQNTLYANMLGGTVDMFFNSAFDPDLGGQLRETWARNGEGTVHPVPGFTRLLHPQWRPAVQREPSVLTPSVRAALYHAIDREALADTVEGRPDLIAHGLLPEVDRNFEGTKDSLRQYGYNPDRARALLREAGWTTAQDGTLRHESDGRRFQTSIWANSRWGRETATTADFWRQQGIEVEEFLIPATLARDREYRASFPGWEATSRYADDIFRPFQDPAANAANRWAGNSNGFEDPRAKALVEAYRRSLTQRDQVEAIRQISQYVAAELPILATYYEADYIGVRKGIKALSDYRGGAGSTASYGTFSRNAYLWTGE